MIIIPVPQYDWGQKNRPRGGREQSVENDTPILFDCHQSRKKKEDRSHGAAGRLSAAGGEERPRTGRLPQFYGTLKGGVKRVDARNPMDYND